MEAQLGVIVYQLNLFNANKTGFINSDGTFILRKEGTYEYTTYFTLKGEVCTGYAKNMFQKAERPMHGYVQF